MNSSPQRAPGHEHIPIYPRGFIAVRILQLIFSVVVTGLSAYSVAVWPLVGDQLILFTSLLTNIVTVWLICAHSCAPRAFNYWAALFFDVYLYIFWLSAFGLLAAETAVYFGAGYEYCDDLGDCSSYSLEGVALTWASIKAASAGLGAFEFLLFFVSLVINSVAIHRHRRAGLHNRPVHGGAMISGNPGVSYQMHYQNKPDYQAVPQQGMPFVAQDTAYSPQGMYNQPPPNGGTTVYGPQMVPPFQGQQPQQAYYQQQQQQQQQHQQQPLAPQHTGESFNKPISPVAPQGPYQAPYQQPYQQQSQY